MSGPPPTARLATAHRVLVVDDSLDMLESMSLVLRLLGHEVMTASSGEDALEVIANWQPHIALIDVGMPGMSGYELARRVRAGAAPRQAVLIAVTGWGRDADRARAAAAGFDRHVVKPVDLPRLEALLSEFPVELAPPVAE
ncbi:response regulator [Gemmatimonas groenlandica]|uniref:Response regulator n=1 Tax=Gemmatimonas groenlandica TaxID=2732249 RepID=A0A6M4IUV9_9BACT|nr:response regulator [Gemmatimonas groenlandica]QJR35941.1 response regulator [Gemmatimonas groenlandica]